MATTLTVAAPMARAADSCKGTAQQPPYTLDLTVQTAQPQAVPEALLWIAPRSPGLTYTDAARGLSLVLGEMFGANLSQTNVRVFFNVYSTGLVPTRVEAVVYYPIGITIMPRVTLRGPFGVLQGQASRPGPEFAGAYARFPLTQAQAGVFAPGSQLNLEVDAGDGTLLESGAYDVADLATMKTLGDAASADLNKNCAAAH